MKKKKKNFIEGKKRKEKKKRIKIEGRAQRSMIHGATHEGFLKGESKKKDQTEKRINMR